MRSTNAIRYGVLSTAALLLLGACAGNGGVTNFVGKQPTVQVGGQPMYPTKTIVENAVNSADHTTLVAAVKAGGLVETLSGSGPFTVFAPTNAAFDQLPAGTVDTLVMPENKEKLVGILTYHVVPGRIDAAALRKDIEAGGGKARLTTASGGTLIAMMNGPRNIVVEDGSGGVANIEVYDVNQSNGVIHSIDHVLLPATPTS